MNFWRVKDYQFNQVIMFWRQQYSVAEKHAQALDKLESRAELNTRRKVKWLSRLPKARPANPRGRN
jgi:hypothetical protein